MIRLFSNCPKYPLIASVHHTKTRVVRPRDWSFVPTFKQKQSTGYFDRRSKPQWYGYLATALIHRSSYPLIVSHGDTAICPLPFPRNINLYFPDSPHFWSATIGGAILWEVQRIAHPFCILSIRLIIDLMRNSLLLTTTETQHIAHPVDLISIFLIDPYGLAFSSTGVTIF